MAVFDRYYDADGNVVSKDRAVLWIRTDEDHDILHEEFLVSHVESMIAAPDAPRGARRYFKTWVDARLYAEGLLKKATRR